MWFNIQFVPKRQVIVAYMANGSTTDLVATGDRFMLHENI